MYEGLPTTLEIAAQGVVDFVETATNLPEIKRDPFLSMLRLRSVFLGLSPEVTLTDRNLAQVGFDNNTSITSNNILLIPHTYRRPDAGQMVSIINTSAARHVMSNHLDIFPMEAITNPETWLMREMDLWPKSHEMYGILSGIPRWNIHPFIQLQLIYSRADMSYLERHQALGRFYIQFSRGRVDTNNRVERKRMALILGKMVPDITAQELELMMKARRCFAKGLIDFTGFDQPRDQLFISALLDIYQQSEIEKAIASLE